MKDKNIEKAMLEGQPEVEPVYIRTGCDLLDILLGGKKDVFGIQAGTILGVWGDSGSGKSFVINELIAANHYRNPDKFKWIDSDSEKGNKFDCKKLYGFEMTSEGHNIHGFIKGDKGALKAADVTFHCNHTVQEMDASLSLFLSSLKEGEYAIYAQDSLDALKDVGDEDAMQERMSKMVAGKEIVDKGSYNLGKQKFLSSFFADHVNELAAKNCLLLLVSQYRAKIGGMVPGQKTVSGGTALKYYCHTILDLTMVRKIEVAGRWIGSVVRARTKNKSRTERPGREVYYTVYFTRGIDNVGSNIDYLFDLRDKDGKLVTDELSWGGTMPTLDTVRPWLEAVPGRLDAYKEFAYKVVGNRRVNLDVVYQWAKQGIVDGEGKQVVAPACPEEYDKQFGRRMKRDELRTLCGNDVNERRKLRQLVIDKWEAAEAAAAAESGFQKTFDNF